MSWKTRNTYTLDDVARGYQVAAAKLQACTTPHKPRRVAAAEASLVEAINLHGSALTVPDEIRDALKAYIDAVEAAIHPPKTTTPGKSTVKAVRPKLVPVPDVTDPTDNNQILLAVLARVENAEARAKAAEKTAKRAVTQAQPKKRQSSGSGRFGWLLAKDDDRK